MTGVPAPTRWSYPSPRTLLFVPGDRADELLTRALQSGADGIILDLEDGVAPEAKRSARAMIGRRLRAAAASRVPVLVRINVAGTPWHDDDVAMVAASAVAGVVVPKCDGPEALGTLWSALGPRLPLLPLVESPRGVLAAPAISAAPGVVGLAFGAIDFAASLETGAAARSQVDHARLHLALTAAATGLWAVDGPCIDLEDRTRLEGEAALARAAGCSGKLVVHPAQIATVHAAFRPTDAEVARARSIIETYEGMISRGQGVKGVNGGMIDAAVAAGARRTIEAAERP